MNKMWKVIRSFVCFLSLVVFFIFIHELSHVIVALCFGNRIIGFGFFFKDDVIAITNLCTFCHVDYINQSSRVFVLIAGSLGNIIVCLISFFLSVKKRMLSLFFSSVSMLIAELFYWIISPVFKFGDAYNTYKLLDIVDYSLLSIIYLGVSIILLIVFAKILERMRMEHKAKGGILGLKQFDKFDATEIYDSGVWKHLTNEEIVSIQLFQERFCFPTVIFHEALENLFGCSILSHDLRYLIKLRKEYLSSGDNNTLKEFMKLISGAIRNEEQ